VEIGMTDFPDFTKPIQEAQAEIIKDREHFTNEDKLPVYNMRRNELKKYMDDEKGGEKNYGLSEEARGDKDFKNPDPFRKKSSTDEDIANALINKTAADEEEKVDVRPIQYKPQKRAPGLEEFKEPEVIPEAEGKAKEAITKFRKVQADIEQTRKQLQEAIAPIQKQLMDTQKPFQEDLVKKQESFSSYLEMIYTQLGETKDKIAAYGDKILAIVERGKRETKSPTIAQLLKRLEEVEPEVFTAVQNVKEAMENEHVSNVLERYLYDYDISKEHEKKKVIRTSDDEGSFNEALKVLKVALMGLLNLNDKLRFEEV